MMAHSLSILWAKYWDKSWACRSASISVDSVKASCFALSKSVRVDSM
nr:hypothetical protein [Helicobacter canis]